MSLLKYSNFSKFSILPIHKAFVFEVRFCSLLGLRAEYGIQQMSARTEQLHHTPQIMFHLAV